MEEQTNPGLVKCVQSTLAVDICMLKILKRAGAYLTLMEEAEMIIAAPFAFEPPTFGKKLCNGRLVTS